MVPTQLAETGYSTGKHHTHPGRDDHGGVKKQLYEFSSDWAFLVGLSGKSGAGGGLVSVVPGKMAIAGISPPLDEVGHSVRAMRMICHVANQLNLHIYSPN